METSRTRRRPRTRAFLLGIVLLLGFSTGAPAEDPASDHGYLHGHTWHGSRGIFDRQLPGSKQPFCMSLHVHEFEVVPQYRDRAIEQRQFPFAGQVHGRKEP